MGIQYNDYNDDDYYDEDDEDEVEHDEMDPKIKKAWVAALTSGAYRQANGTLREPATAGGHTKHCCLGVLCDMYAKAKPHTGARWEKDVDGYGGSRATFYDRVDADGGENSMPPSSVHEWAGLTMEAADHLATMNDNGEKFSKIAAWIKENL